MLFHLRKGYRKKELTVLILVALHFNIPMCKKQSLKSKKKKKIPYPNNYTAISLFNQAPEHSVSFET